MLTCNFFSFVLLVLILILFYVLYVSGNFIVDLDDKPSEKSKGVSNYGGPAVTDLSSLKREPALQMKNNDVSDGFRLDAKGISYSPVKTPSKELAKPFENSGNDLETRAQKDAYSLRNSGRAVKGRAQSPEVASELLLDAAMDPTLPTEVNREVLFLLPFLYAFS